MSTSKEHTGSHVPMRASTLESYRHKTKSSALGSARPSSSNERLMSNRSILIYLEASLAPCHKGPDRRRTSGVGVGTVTAWHF
ncbi:hypothetical protein RRG08_034083 [Elysia crispata]|uniref:Uncharacterized protein n=1 Tax=Elysia crispata TaxID=231223 RepID=A0AAE0YSI3_9GAST|nr:hypothetical protein RRG08_034083 [Elysia crispata]